MSVAQSRPRKHYRFDTDIGDQRLVNRALSIVAGIDCCKPDNSALCYELITRLRYAS